ncbi:GMC family oxidoreductase [Rhodovibrio salinarum]|uniref:Choline dehydrogenase n=1 Tax=Rhodovibrio salinarum TaxID=1087 RepID=A0A934QIT1_9PROT|nr:choline dehydrogenase [Rhodovibrio salinarum]MBK1697215.1 choline dehydrogenase [Rhodovibrio salinarum]
MDKAATRYDYVIAGGGSAGCVLAARLSEDPDIRVLLIEAGSSDSHPMIHIPAGFTKLAGPRVNWGYKTVPQRHLNDREMWYPQGRTLGGGSSINAMIYTRGHAADYDRWAREGCDQWSYDQVLPYFRKAEANSRLNNVYHGIDGPLSVSDPISPREITRAFLKAAQDTGARFTPDFNGESQTGVGFHQTTTVRGRRASAAVCYLHPARSRPNLDVATRATTTRLLIEKGRAVGVRYRQDRNGEEQEVRADREVLVTSGAIGSPKLLMLSGIGRPDHLRGHGIDVVHELTGVGENLQDHLDCYVTAYCDGPHSYFGTDRYFEQAWWALQYILFGNGPATTNVVEAGGFVSVDPASEIPDTQLHFLPAFVIEHGMVRVKDYGISLYTNFLRPHSRGNVRLRSADPGAAPLIDPGYFSAEEDRRMAVEALKYAREILARPAIAKYLKGEHMPGPDVRTDAELLDYARAWAKTDYHPVGTCRMGEDAEAVVDQRLRVRGVEGLRVCDSSVMPSEISGNTNAPTIMIAERAAEMIKADAAGARAA